MSVITFKIPKD